MRKALAVKYILFSVLTAVMVFFDQISKKWIVDITGGTEGKGIAVIKNVLNFTFIKNEGASMGLFKGQGIFIILVTVVILAWGLWYFKKHLPENVLFLASVSLIASGAVGNLIDRINLGYVRDFIDIQFVKFYIFNVADCAICIGAALMILYAFLNVED